MQQAVQPENMQGCGWSAVTRSDPTSDPALSHLPLFTFAPSAGVLRGPGPAQRAAAASGRHLAAPVWLAPPWQACGSGGCTSHELPPFQECGSHGHQVWQREWLRVSAGCGCLLVCLFWCAKWGVRLCACRLLGCLTAGRKGRCGANRAEPCLCGLCLLQVLLSASGTAKLADVGLSRLQNRTVMSDLSLMGTFAW